jgi:N-dimethylarginine dimethylaminohydrolase
MAFGVHREWDRLREAVVGIAPADDIVLFHEHSRRWLSPAAAERASRQSGRRLIEVDPALAGRIEKQAKALASLLEREGVRVHRPEPLCDAERTFLAPNGEGIQLFVRDALIVAGPHVIDASLRLQCRQRERFGLRPVVQRLIAERGARWSSVPFGSPGAVDGPFLEGGDVMLNGPEIYVGMSGCASDMAGIDWFQALLGADHRVVPVALRSHVLHLDWALALIRPGLLLYCPDNLIDGLPTALRPWDKIELTVEEAAALSAGLLVLEPGRAVVEASNRRVIEAMRERRVETIPLAFEAPAILGGSLRSACQPLLREDPPA